VPERLRHSVTAAASAALLAVLLGPAATAAATPSAVVATGRYALGDSVMLGARSGLTARGFQVNAAESRQFSAAVSIVRAKVANRTLPRNVVLALGTNGYIRTSDCTAIVSAAGTARRIFLVTNRVPRTWQASNNRVLKACDAAFTSSRVVLVDWYTYSAGRASWFYSDGIHLKPAGRSAYATMLDAKLDALGK
jgi:lysophospholipase L1-like esterase